jgi:UDP-N-acetylmuramoyl-tripeptide--D-alanyl-D-alanine ligase
MSSGFRLGQLAEVLAISGDPEFAHQHVAGISTDSRALQTGEIFLALQGERFDGHAFVPQALQQGAIAAIVNQNTLGNFDPALHLRLFPVPDTLAAYQAIAHWWRNQFSIPVVAVTGSVGKTTTKELIAAVLGTQGLVLKTQANYNNEIGVPKTLLELRSEHRFAVIEMGMRGAGQIAELAQIARPDIAVITNVGTAHIELLGSEQAIAQAKCELLAELSPRGIAVLNHDNPRLIKTAKTVWAGQTLTFGLEGGDVQGKLLDASMLDVNGQILTLPLEGQHNALNFLAALTVAQAVGIDWVSLPHPLLVDLPGGRAKRYTLRDNVLILDETYNAGPESMLAALKLLAQTAGQRRIAVLGTMRELGERSPDFHYQIGVAVRELNLDELLILADDREAEALIAGAAPLVTRRFQTHADIAAYLKTSVKPGDRLLFKASRAVALEQTVEKFRLAWGN